MATKAAGATVVSLESHPAWRAAQRRSAELEAAMRRHPSFQAAPDTTPDDHHAAHHGDHHPVVRQLRAL